MSQIIVNGFYSRLFFLKQSMLIIENTWSGLLQDHFRLEFMGTNYILKSSLDRFMRTYLGV